jgi:hypothetical protein
MVCGLDGLGIGDIFLAALGIYHCSRESRLVPSHRATFLVDTNVLSLGYEAELGKDRRTWRDLAEKAKTHKGL